MKTGDEIAEIIGDVLCEIAPTLSEVNVHSWRIVERLRQAGYDIKRRK